MEKQNGKMISKGIAIGRIHFYSKEQSRIIRRKVEDTKAEIKRYETVKNTAREQLEALYQRAFKEAGESGAQIFEVHRMMLEDEDYNDFVHHFITEEKVNAEYAVAATKEHFAEIFANMEDDYFKARSADVKDISERLIAILTGRKVKDDIGEESQIIVAEDLAPSETVSMDKSKVSAFVTERTSANSHTAILAKTMGIPALTDISIQPSWEGKTAILDGEKGELYVEPDAELLEEYQKKQEEEKLKRDFLLSLKGKESVTLSGQKIKLCANIGNISDLADVFLNDADGIGLFRSEFLYLQNDRFPTEEEQFLIYRQAAEAMAGKQVIIRTLDLGADKQADYFQLEKEENPALGYRAIRICLTRLDIFKTQLRALFRASYYGNLAIMYPMITSLEEVKEIKAIAEEVKAELRREGVSYGNAEQGIMIETPAAAVLSDLLAEEVDFFSIGTNDLTQYTLAIDRQNAKLDKFYNPHSKAILRLIELVVNNAHAKGIWVGICGELGADTELTAHFLAMGVDELSVSPNCILPIRKMIREMK